MSEDCFNVISPVTQLSDDLSNLRTKRFLHRSPTRHHPYSNCRTTPKSVLGSQAFPELSPSSSFVGNSSLIQSMTGVYCNEEDAYPVDQLCHLQLSSKYGSVIAEASYRKAIQSDLAVQRAQQSPRCSIVAHTGTPPGLLRANSSQDKNMFGTVNASTPLSSFSGGRMTRSNRRTPPKCIYKSCSSDRENVPPPESSNFQNSLTISDRKDFGSIFKRSNGFGNVLSTSSKAKRPTEDANVAIPPKKLKSEVRMALFETGIVEADKFEAITQIKESTKFCGQLNYFTSDLKSSESNTFISSPLTPQVIPNFPTESSVANEQNRFLSDQSINQDDARLTVIEEHLDHEDSQVTLCLPLIAGKRHDCSSISVETLRKVIEGNYNDLFDEFTIIDCRYPYEYTGGHIKDAVNIYTREEIDRTFMEGRVQSVRKSVLIFHCEFSSERGPRLMQHLRSIDRQANLEVYPHLYYPELYLLDGGYKAFFETLPTFCEPMTYKPMVHEDHIHDLRHFKSKSKSWAFGDSKTGFTKGTKRNGLRSSRRRCLADGVLTEADESVRSGHPRGQNEEKLPAVDCSKKKNQRVLFLSYHSDTSCQDDPRNELDCLGLRVID